MSLSIRALTPDMGSVFVQYLEELEFRHSPDWKGCFCRFYHEKCSFKEWIERTHDQNRADAIQAIATGTMKGYLAFDGEVCVGWLNANDALAYPRLIADLQEYIAGKKVGLTICFVIRPEYRGQGVARQLLSAAIEGFRQAGYDAAISLPIARDTHPEKRYRGTLHMYDEEGYQVLARREDIEVRWLDLQHQ